MCYHLDLENLLRWLIRKSLLGWRPKTDSKTQLKQRMAQCGLELHPEKTKIFYCRDGYRTGKYKGTSFDFLGFMFRPRQAVIRMGKRRFLGFNPAVSQKSKKKMVKRGREMRGFLRSDMELREVAEKFNPILRGWVNYYGTFYPSQLRKVYYDALMTTFWSGGPGRSTRSSVV